MKTKNINPLLNWDHDITPTPFNDVGVSLLECIQNNWKNKKITLYLAVSSRVVNIKVVSTNLQFVILHDSLLDLDTLDLTTNHGTWASLKLSKADVKEALNQYVFAGAGKCVLNKP